MNILQLMNVKHIALVLSIAAISLAPAVTAASTCNVRAKVPAAARAFAKINNQSAWREYRGIKFMPILELNGGASAQFWQDRNKSRSVVTVERDQDYETYTRYCFNSDGELEGVGFEIRTLLGWGHRTEGSVLGGGFAANLEEFFSLKNGKTIFRPEGVATAPAALKPTLYLKLTELPFAPLLAQTTSSKRH